MQVSLGQNRIKYTYTLKRPNTFQNQISLFTNYLVLLKLNLSVMGLSLGRDGARLSLMKH